MSELTTVGSLKGITEKPSGWTTIEVAEPGKQYPLKLDTKIQELIDAARATGGQVATWKYSEAESEQINDRTGKPYINRRFEGVELGAAAGPSGSTPGHESAGPEAHHEAIHFADKDRAISRMALLKAAATIFEGKATTVYEDGSEDDVPHAVMKAAQRFEQWLYRDIDDIPF